MKSAVTLNWKAAALTAQTKVNFIDKFKLDLCFYQNTRFNFLLKNDLLHFENALSQFTSSKEIVFKGV